MCERECAIVYLSLNVCVSVFFFGGGGTKINFLLDM